MSNYVSIESWLDSVRRNNFFWYWALSSFVWMCFHFTLVFFFLLVLKNAMVVWIFLWLWNLVSFFLDSPVWVLQKYFSAKKLFIFSASLMFVVSVIFLYFIYTAWNIDISAKDILTLSAEAFRRVFWSFLNIILLLISVIFYWTIKELSDVTSLSYIMNNADPSEYAELLSKNNIFSGLWALGWLLASWIFLAFYPFFAVCTLVLIVAIFLIFIMRYFDNRKEEFKININLWDIKNFKVISPKETLESVKQYNIANISKPDFAKASSQMKFIFLKPIEIKKSVNWKEVADTSKEEMKTFIEILFKPPYSSKLLVIWWVLTFFGLWDTFVTSFLIDFLNSVIKWSADVPLKSLMSAYVFIAILAIPAYWAQVPLINISKKIWTFPVMFAWVLVSWISIFLFWVFNSFWMILLLWIVNSFWYAASMPLSQWDFSDEYNQVFATKKNLTEIDSNASSAPIKMLLNLANVVWLVLWWLLVTIIWYTWTFVVFWAFLIWLFFISISKKKEWKL